MNQIFLVSIKCRWYESNWMHLYMKKCEISLAIMLFSECYCENLPFRSFSLFIISYVCSWASRYIHQPKLHFSSPRTVSIYNLLFRASGIFTWCIDSWYCTQINLFISVPVTVTFHCAVAVADIVLFAQVLLGCQKLELMNVRCGHWRNDVNIITWYTHLCRSAYSLYRCLTGVLDLQLVVSI